VPYDRKVGPMAPAFTTTNRWCNLHMWFPGAAMTSHHLLGPYPLVSLSEARDKAMAQRRLLLDGIDPIAARDAKQPARDPVTFAAAAKQYIAGHEKAWKSGDHARQWRNSLDRYVLPAIGERPISAIDTHDVLSIVEPLWQDKTETATRVLNRMSLILDWATARKLRTADNPARWKGHLDAVLPKRSKVQKVINHSALPYSQLSQFMTALHQQSEIGARAAELMILTATRTVSGQKAARDRRYIAHKRGIPATHGNSYER
jgi:hypothetical protein